MDMSMAPKAIIADQYFHEAKFRNFYESRNIKPISRGPRTRSPNRAEAPVKLVKKTRDILVRSIQELAELQHIPITVDIVVQKCVRLRSDLNHLECPL